MNVLPDDDKLGVALEDNILDKSSILFTSTSPPMGVPWFRQGGDVARVKLVQLGHKIDANNIVMFHRQAVLSA